MKNATRYTDFQNLVYSSESRQFCQLFLSNQLCKKIYYALQQEHTEIAKEQLPPNMNQFK